MNPDRTPRLLLVDNDESYLEALAVRLRHAGFGVKTAVSGAQGFLAAGLHDFDVIVTDLQMPGGDGICLVERIRQQSPIPIIVATGFSDEFAQEIARIPALRVIRKPFAVEDLMLLIDALVAVGEER